MRIFTLLVSIATLIAAPVACGGPENGIGQGQPAYTGPTGTAAKRQPLQINAVFVAADSAAATFTNAGLGYIEITNQGNTDIDFNQVALSLVSTQGSIALSPSTIPSLQTPLAANTARPLTDAALAPFAQRLKYQSDQVAIVDATFVVAAYLAWGSTPPSAGALPPLTAGALKSGAIAQPSDAFVAIPATANAATSAYIQ